MSSLAIRTLALITLATATVLAQTGTSGGPRIVAIGDVHGAADAFAEILQKVGLIDASRRWTGGNATFVQTGDVTDRGPKVRATLDLLMSLEEQAPASGGRVLALLGNHETMNLIGDLHDVPPAAYASFADERSEERRERAYHDYAAICRAREAAVSPVPPVYQLPSKEAWMKTHPPGYLEYVEAFGPEGLYGRWLRSRPTTVKLGDTLFLHGGIAPRVAGEKPEAISKQVQREIHNLDEYREHLVSRKIILPWFDLEQILQAATAETGAVVAAGERPSALDAPAGGPLDARHAHVLQGLSSISQWSVVREDGPLWFRGYATWTPEEGLREIQLITRKMGVKRIVVGHTVPSTMRITPRFRRSVFLIDTGMLASNYAGGRVSALEIRDGRVTAEYLDSTVQLDPPTPTARNLELIPPSGDSDRSGDRQWVEGMVGR